MAGATEPDGIAFIELGDEIDPVQESANQASSIQIAFNDRVIFTYRWANISERNAAADMKGGEYGFQDDTNTPYIYIGDNLGWQPLGYGTSRSWGDKVLVTPTGTATPYSVLYTVVFPPGLFSSVPVIQITPHTAVPDKVHASFTEPTSAGCKIKLIRTDAATATTIHISAEQR